MPRWIARLSRHSLVVTGVQRQGLYGRVSPANRPADGFAKGLFTVAAFIPGQRIGFRSMALISGDETILRSWSADRTAIAKSSQPG